MQLVETAQRSRRTGDTRPALLPGDKTNVSPGDALSKPPIRPDPTPLPPANTPNTSTHEIHHLKPPPNRQGSIKPHYTTRANTRQHSFKVPTLPDIESSDSDRSGPPSPDAFRPRQDSDTSDEAYKDATRMRESVDDRVSGYLLALAARQAEKQLREQEAAAFPNTDYHEPVAHYMDRSDSEESISEPKLGRHGKVVRDRTRRDSADEKWAMKEMRKHGEKVFQQQQARKKTAAFNVEFDSQVFRDDIWRTAGGQFDGPTRNPKNLIGGYQRDSGLKQMRKAASPPMLGGDIDFPRCPSPEHARFDVTQGADFLRKNMCYLSEQSGDRSGLWGLRKPSRPPPQSAGSSAVGCWGGIQAPKAQKPKSPPPGGLWGGCCTNADKANASPPSTGLITPLATPKVEKEDPFSSSFATNFSFSSKNSYTNLSSLGNGPVQARQPVSSAARAPPSPPPSVGSASNSLSAPQCDLDARLAVEAQIDSEFDNAFTTQVFNYLSLGYPSLARKFDDELSRISRVPVEELRQDDKLAEVRGYVRLGSNEIDGEDGIEEHMCNRWKALQRYVREWGRQMIRRELDGGDAWAADPLRAWGLPARKGSWGL